jgi:peroxiredoxin
LVIAAALVGSPRPGASAEPERPWYADRLMKLGFRVLQKPEVAPDFEVEALSGGTIRLSDFKGKVVLLNLWATWCPPCREELPSLRTLWEKTKSKPFALLAVSQGESRQTVQSFIDKNRYDLPVYIDPKGRSGSLYGARSIPTTCVIDKQGRLIAFVVGGLSYDTPEALALFADLADR